MEMKEAIDEIHNLILQANAKIDVQARQTEILQSTQEQLSKTVDIMSNKLLDPETGLIVKFNQNVESHKRLAQQFNEYPIIVKEVNVLTKWRKNATKVLWMLITAAIAYFSDLFKR